MFFMRVPIDVVFVRSEKRNHGKDQKVISSMFQSVQPWKPLLFDLKANDTIELPEGTIEKCRIQPGDELSLSLT